MIKAIQRFLQRLLRPKAQQPNFDLRHGFKQEAHELSIDECDRLAEFFETPAWITMQKLFQIQRLEQINQYLIHAKDPMEIGEVKGAIGMLNKIEHLLSSHHVDMYERKRRKEEQETDADES